MPNNAQQAPGCLGFLFNLFGVSLSNSKKREIVQTSGEIKKKEENKRLPYRLRDDFLSPAEISFYHVLKNVVGEQGVICPKVRLADLFFVSNPNKNYSYFNKIVSKHIDFVLCEPKTMRPLMAFELNDASHDQSNRKKRDNFVKHVFQDAHVPLLFLRAKRTYNTQELAAVVNRILNPASKPVDTTKPVSNAPDNGQLIEKPVRTNAPLCPKCDVPMVVRVAKQGEHSGEKFYGCPNFPKCREVRAYREREELDQTTS